LDDLFGSPGYAMYLASGRDPWGIAASGTIDTQGGFVLEGGVSWSWDAILSLPRE
jgi:hypothetical protein